MRTIALEILEQRGPVALAADSKRSDQDSEAQQGRWPLELGQNAEDSLHRIQGGKGKLAFVVVGNDLLVANNGAAFDARDLRSLAFAGLSGKVSRGGGACAVCGQDVHRNIGHKGIGFTATRQIASDFAVSSGDLTFQFSRRQSWKDYEARWSGEIASAIEARAGWWTDAVLGEQPAWFPALLPAPWNDPPQAVMDLHRRGYVTVFCFRGAARRGLMEVRQALKSELVTALLFFQHLSRIEWAVEDGDDHDWIERRPVNAVLPEGWAKVEVVGSRLARAEWYVVRSNSGVVVPEVLKQDHGERFPIERFRSAAAIPAEPAGVAGSVCVYYPTHHPTGAAIHFHGDFRTDTSRQAISLKGGLNRWAVPTFASWFRRVVLPGMRALESDNACGWALKVLRHPESLAGVAADLWGAICGSEYSLPAGATEADEAIGEAWEAIDGKALGDIQLVPVIGSTSVGAVDAVILGSRAVAALLPDGLQNARLLVPELLGDTALLHFLRRLGAREFAVVEHRSHDLEDLAAALRAHPLGTIEEAVAVADMLFDVSGPARLQGEDRRLVRAIPCWPCQTIHGTDFIDALGHERTGRRRRARPCLRAERVPSPPADLPARDRLVEEPFQFSSPPTDEQDAEERRFVDWLRDSEIVPPQRGRALVASIAADLSPQWAAAPDDQRWWDIWRRFIKWALDVVELRSGGSWQDEQRPHVAAIVLPAKLTNGERVLRPAAQVVLTTDNALTRELSLLGDNAPPVIDDDAVAEWLETDDGPVERVANLVGLSLGVRLPKLEVGWGSVDFSPEALPPTPASWGRPQTEVGKQLAHTSWQAYRKQLSDRLDTWQVNAMGPVKFLPPWAYDVLGGGDVAARRSLYRLLDLVWVGDDDWVRWKRGKAGRDRPHLRCPAAESLRELEWLPVCEPPRLVSPLDAVHLCDTGADLEIGLLPIVPSQSMGPFERALDVGWLGDWRCLARQAAALIDRMPDSSEGIALRNAWIRTLRQLYWRLSQQLSTIPAFEVEQVRSCLAGQRSADDGRPATLPRVLGLVDGAPCPVSWTNGLLGRMRPELEALVPPDRHIFYFKRDGLSDLCAVLGVQDAETELAGPIEPAWDDLRPSSAEYLEPVRDLLLAALLLAPNSRRAVSVALGLEIRLSERLQRPFAGRGVALCSHGDSDGRIWLIDDHRPDDLVRAIDQAFPGYGLSKRLDRAIDYQLAGKPKGAWQRLASDCEADPSTVDELRRKLEAGAIDGLLNGLPGEAPIVRNGLPIRMDISTGEVENDEEPESNLIADEALPDQEAIDAALDALDQAGTLEHAPSNSAGHNIAGGTAERAGNVHVGKPDATLGRAAELACLRRARRNGVDAAVHDVHARPWFGADFVLTAPDAPPPPGPGEGGVQDWLETHATGFLECKGTADGSPTRLIFPDREKRRARWARERGVPYHVEVWQMVRRGSGPWLPSATWAAPPPDASRLEAMKVTWLMRLSARAPLSPPDGSTSIEGGSDTGATEA